MVMKNKDRIDRLEKEVAELIEENTALRQRVAALETWKPTQPYPYPLPTAPRWVPFPTYGPVIGRKAVDDA